MPSLRRSFSSSFVRSSPYPSSLSAANPSTIRARAAPHPRRSSGSATAERRVLADIEWWRVYDGQCDLDLRDHVQEDVQTLAGGAPSDDMVTLSAGGGFIEPPLSLHSLSVDSVQSFRVNSFAALSIAPYSPQGLGRRHDRDSSVDSTPELSTAPLEAVQLSLEHPVSCPIAHPFSFSAPPTQLDNRHPHPLFGLRSVSAPALSHQGTFESVFADMGGESFSLDQNLFQ